MNMSYDYKHENISLADEVDREKMKNILEAMQFLKFEAFKTNDSTTYNLISSSFRILEIAYGLADERKRSVSNEAH